MKINLKYLEQDIRDNLLEKTKKVFWMLPS